MMSSSIGECSDNEKYGYQMGYRFVESPAGSLAVLDSSFRFFAVLE